MDQTSYQIFHHFQGGGGGGKIVLQDLCSTGSKKFTLSQFRFAFMSKNATARTQIEPTQSQVQEEAFNNSTGVKLESEDLDDEIPDEEKLLPLSSLTVNSIGSTSNTIIHNTGLLLPNNSIKLEQETQPNFDENETEQLPNSQRGNYTV